MKPSEAIRVMTKLFAFFPGAPNDTLVAYSSKLQDLDAGDVEQAIDELIETQTRLPSLALVLDIATRPVRMRAEAEREERIAQQTRDALKRYDPEKVHPASKDAVQAIFARYFARHPDAQQYRDRAASRASTPGGPDA